MRTVLLLLCIGLATAITLDESIFKLNELETAVRSGLIINDEHFKIQSDINEIWRLFDELREYQPAAQLRLKQQNVEAQPLAWSFIPYTQGRIMLGRPFSYIDPCFESITAEIVEFNSTNCTISFRTAAKKNATCTSFYNVNTREGGFFLELDRANHVVNVTKALQEYEYDDISNFGWMVFYWPLGISGTIESIVNTVLLFAGPDMIPRNVDFFAHNMQWALKDRYAGFVNVSATEILSGTGLAVVRLDGLDPLIGWGTGGHTGHSTMALWFDDDDNKSHGPTDEDDLYIVESIGMVDYWPAPWGWIKTPWYEWQQKAINANYNVAMMKLAPEYQLKFDEVTARTYFEQWEGTPYGIQSFIFIFVDTLLYNLPYPCTPDLFTLLATFVERIIPPQISLSAYTLLIEGYNHRLNSNCTTLQCVFDIIDPMKIDLLELTTWPESDSYMYDGHPSLTCASFVTAMYKAAGIFSAIDTQINASEQTPKDLYQMAIWDPNWQLPPGCKKADPALPYCQFLGSFSLPLPGWNSIVPYKNINEICPSLGPVYYRAPGC